MAYTTVDNVQEYLRTTFGTDTTPTLTEVTGMVASIDEVLEDLIGTKFGTVGTDSQIFDIQNSTNELLVRKLPLYDITDVFINEGSEFTPVWTSISSLGVNSRQMDNFAVLSRDFVGNQKIKVEYEYGYDYIPVNVTKLATLLVAREINESADASSNEFQEYKIGPITAKTNIGAQRFANLDVNIAKLCRLIGNFKKVQR